MNHSAIRDRAGAQRSGVARLGRCLGCGLNLDGNSNCRSCGREHPEVDGILHAIGPLSGTNRIAGAFYDGPTWPRFRFWEQVFLFFQGLGPTNARRKVLRHLPNLERARVLEVGIGDGANVPLLPREWELFGVDIARTRLEACRSRYPKTSSRLAWAEAEALPFENASFDVVFTVGGINYFRDPELALCEMKRVARPGATLLAADERADLFRFSPGHILGLEFLDRLSLQFMGLDREFVSMVFETPQGRVEECARRAWPGHRRIPVWNRLGYCLVDVREG